MRDFSRERGRFLRAIPGLIGRFFTLILGIFLAVSLSILFIFTWISLSGNARIKTLDKLPAKVDCIIVPGAQVIGNRRPSPMLQDRLDGAIQLYRAGLSERILVSGDHREDNYNEPRVMRDYLIQEGIPEEAIFMDHFGLDTYDTIYRAREVFQIRTAIVATQRFHLQRALYISKKTGLEASGYATDPRVYLDHTYLLIREFGARIKAVYETRTGALPLHSSPVRPIWGDGRTSWDSF